jgi:tripartite-type tricarboxylate transporter receptor subunit TctC
MKKVFCGFFFCLAASVASVHALGAETEAFPSKRIIWVAPYSPGGGVDVFTRAVAREVTKELGASVIVQNIPGGGGRIGASHVYRSRPDGHTLGTYVIGSLIIPQILFDEAPYDVRQFVWVGAPFSSPFGVFVAANSPIHSLHDLKKLGRPVWIAEIDVTGTPVPPTVLMMKALNFEYKYITGYGGQALMNPALIRGEADMLLRTIPSQLPWKNDIRNIATMARKRHPLAPDVPTVVEQLGPAAEEILPLSNGTYLVGAPPGTPPHAVQALERAILKAVESPALRKWAERTGFIHDLAAMGSAETKKIVEDYIASLNRDAGALKAVMKR